MMPESDPPASEAEIRARAPAICLKPVNVEAPASAPCRFGGDPCLPARVAWPKDAAGRPMHHLLQIDCARLPAVDPDFPREGTLLLFVAGSGDERGASSVLDGGPGTSALIWLPTAPEAVAPRPHPDTVPALGEYSLALEPVVVPAEPEQQNFLARLFDTQPKKYSKTTTGTFAPVALEPLMFDSHPDTDPRAVYAALDLPVTEDACSRGVRLHQMLGYAHEPEDLHRLDAEGYMEASVAKAGAAYDLARAREQAAPDDTPVLLFQLCTSKELNLDVGGFAHMPRHVLRVLIDRRDLRARAFDRHRTAWDEVHDDGLWEYPDLPGERYAVQPEDRMPAVVLKPLTLDETPSSRANYYLGWPQLPDMIAWPRREVRTSRGHTQSVPLHFMMQIDCASVSRSVDVEGQSLTLPPFPEQGTLFVFIDTISEELDDDAVRVLFHPEPVDASPRRQPPSDLVSPRGSDEGMEVPAPLRDLGGEIATWPENARVPFEPLTYAGFVAPDGADYEAVDRSEIDVMRAVLPPEPRAIRSVQFVADWLPGWYRLFLEARREDWSVGRRNGVIRHVPASYPWRWLDIRDAALLYCPEYSDDPEDIAARQALFPDDLDAAVRDWYRQSLDHDPLARIDEATRAAYRDWLIGLDAAAAARVPAEQPDEDHAAFRRRWTLEFAHRGTLAPLAMPPIDFALSCIGCDPDADDLPAEIREVASDLLRFTRSYTKLRADNVAHRPNLDRLFAPVEEHERGEETDVLLFRFSSGYGMKGLWRHCYDFQIWIDRDDLAAGRFDRVRRKTLF